MEQLRYLHLGQVIWEIVDVLIVTGFLPNGAVAGHLSTNSSDSVAPLYISFTENPMAGLTVTHVPGQQR